MTTPHKDETERHLGNVDYCHNFCRFGLFIFDLFLLSISQLFFYFLPSLGFEPIASFCRVYLGPLSQ